jgi:hypothetical protein
MEFTRQLQEKINDDESPIGFYPETLGHFEGLIQVTAKVAEMMKHTEYYFSGDISEQTYNERMMRVYKNG